MANLAILGLTPDSVSLDYLIGLREGKSHNGGTSHSRLEVLSQNVNLAVSRNDTDGIFVALWKFNKHIYKHKLTF